MNQTAIEPVELPQQQSSSLMTVIERLASNPNVDIDKLRQLLEMQERWELNRDKSALRHAMAEFKKNPPEIIKSRVAKVKMKDEKGTFTYNYADLEIITTAIQDGLAKHGVTHSYSTNDTGAMISVTCILKYGLYEEPGVTLTAGPDMSGTKNALQGKGSTLSYLEKYCLLAAAGVAAGMPDNDGQTQGDSQGIDGDVLSAQIKRIKGCADAIDLQRVFTEAYKIANDANDKDATGQIIRARDERKQELKAANLPPPVQGGHRIAEPLIIERLDWIKDANDKDELKRIYNNAIKMANQAGDAAFADQLTRAANKRAEEIREGR